MLAAILLVLFQGGQATTIRHGADLPATCTANQDVFIKDGSGPYWCSLTNTWTAFVTGDPDVNIIKVGGMTIGTSVPVTGTVAVDTSTLATSAKQDTGNASLATIATNSGTQATAANQTTGNASLSTIATNSGTQATAANQTTGNSSLSTIAAKDFATQTTLALIKAKTDNIDVASSTLATAANQTTGNSSLSTIATNSGTQATAANQTTGNSSLSTIASNTTTIAGVSFATSGNQATEISSLSTIASNSGTQATAANQTTGNSSLSTIATNTTTISTISGAVATRGAAAPSTVMVVGTSDAFGNTSGVLQVQAVGTRTLRNACNALRKTNCQ